VIHPGRSTSIPPSEASAVRPVSPPVQVLASGDPEGIAPRCFLPPSDQRRSVQPCFMRELGKSRVKTPSGAGRSPVAAGPGVMSPRGARRGRVSPASRRRGAPERPPRRRGCPPCAGSVRDRVRRPIILSKGKNLSVRDFGAHTGSTESRRFSAFLVAGRWGTWIPRRSGGPHFVRAGFPGHRDRGSSAAEVAAAGNRGRFR